MARRQPSGLTRFFRSFIRQVLSGRRPDADRNSKRRLKFESLEGRQLLASDLASLSGVVTLGGTPVEGATIGIYADDGDGVFEPGGDDGATIGTDTTDVTGAYRFDRLPAGTYWLEQQAQTTGGGTELGEFVSSLITITAPQADGTLGLTIDDFDDDPAATVAADDVTNPNGLAADHAAALGGERDMFVTLTSGTTTPSVSLTSNGNQLIFNSSFDATGDFASIYDGNDDDAQATDFTGLGGVDLTNSGTDVAIKVRVQADQADATVRLRVYTDADNFSDSDPFVIPGTNSPTDAVFYFADFTQAGGTGPADFANVGAMQLLIETTTAGTDGMVTVLGAFSQNVVTQDIDNEADLSLTKSVDNATPNVGDNVTFTITLANAASGAGATGVEVTDLLPAGLAFVSATPAAGTTYDDETGVWDVGSLAAGENVVLTIVAEVEDHLELTNTSTITDADQDDPDAGNNSASAIVDALDADLSLGMTVSNPAPNLGDEVTFTLTLTNSGPDGATGVQVTDLLPAGLTFVSANPEAGTTYDDETGIWNIGAVGSAESVVLEIVAEVTSTAAIDNTAQVTAAGQFDPDSTPGDGAGDDFASQVVDAQPAADLSLLLEVDDSTPTAGSNVTFTITVTNAGPDEATGIEVVDLLPAGLTFDSATAEQGTYTDNDGVWVVGTLASGASTTLTIVAEVTGALPITNTAQVTAAGQFDPDSTPNDGAGDDFGSVTLEEEPTADLSLTQGVSNLTPNLGDEITITLTLTNGGPDEATGIVVTDQLPAGLAFVSADPSVGDYDEATGLWTIASLASSGTATLDIVATVTSTAPLVNDAEVTAVDQVDSDSTPDDGSGDDFATATIDAAAAADLSVTLNANDVTPDADQDVTFTITVSNAGPDTATGIELTSLLPAGLTFVSATEEQGDYTNNDGLWLVGSLASGESATLTLVATVTGSLPLVLAAELTAAGEFDPDSTADDGQGDDFATVTLDAPAQADLSLAQSVSDLTPDLGDEITITLTLTNGGPGTSTNIVVTDLLPAGLTFVSSDPSVGTYNEVTGEWTIPTLAASGTATLEIVATVASTANIVNEAEVTAADSIDPDSTPDDGAGDDFATATIDVNPAADLALTMTASDNTPNLGENVTFTLTLANGGPDAATGVAVTDLLPAGLTFVSANASQGSYVAATGLWTVGTVNSGANATLAIVATVTSGAAIDNEAEVTAVNEFDPDSTPDDGAGDDFASQTIDANPAADLAITKTASSATPNLGTNVTFTITVTNSGPDGATGVEVTDLLPAGLTFVSATPSQGDYTQGTGIWDVGTVAASGNATLTIVATVTSTTAITNIAEVTASDVFDPDSTPDDDTGDDRATVTIDAPPAADLSVTKTVSNATPNFGSNVTFTVTVSNAGPDQATGVAVTDQLPAGLVFVSSTPSQGSYVSGTGLWTVGSINSGASATLTIVARVNSTAALNNVAQVTASGVFDPDSTPNDNTGDDRATVTVDAPAAADLRLAKTASSAFVGVGQNITFTLTLTNDGPDGATGVQVTDLLPAGLTFVSSTPSQGTYVSATGLWTVGSIANGATATLQIVATLATAGTKVNVAQVTASEVFDPDSTPNDNQGDDRATVEVGSTKLSKRMFLAR
ncbi:MAG: SpaA isopeptide-forming pilin-related protein [Pirellulaceae bacterium]|nr:SpaA isopeptide-forming pilin-related protein [Pirellulaceae bacterium]